MRGDGCSFYNGIVAFVRVYRMYYGRVKAALWQACGRFVVALWQVCGSFLVGSQQLYGS